MKTKLTLLLLLILPTAFAQRQDASAACRQAMSKLAYFVGEWEGKANAMTRNGPLELHQTEHIEWRLQDLVLVIEGTGRMASGEVNFNAMAVINFDPADQHYKLRSYVKEGYYTDAYFTLLAPNQFEWGFDVQGGKTRYQITLDENAKTWKEVGEFSADGQTWRKFIDLLLTKK